MKRIVLRAFRMDIAEVLSPGLQLCRFPLDAAELVYDSFDLRRLSPWKSVVGSTLLISGFGVHDLSSRIITIASTRPAVRRMKQTVPTR